MTTPKKSSSNFRDAYQVLQKHAQTLRTSSEPNIDDLLDIVNESVEAYKICKQRIDAVEKALAEALEDEEIAGFTAATEEDADDDLDDDNPPF
ncbi:MAG TPA: hypothetical protein VK032_01365 [Burkholderiaceae bacterium]|nr:hypothetical protein [Burkholderiaceae bacterium]